MAVGIFFGDYANSAVLASTGGNYATAHDAVSGSLTLLSNIADNDSYYFAKNTYYSGQYRVSRWMVNIDCATLPGAATISAAKLHFPNFGNWEGDDGHSDIDIVEGIFGTPPVVEDYYNQLPKIVAGGTVVYPPDDLWPGRTVPVPTALNSTGRGWITKAGDTKLCLRLRGDVDDATPTGINRIYTRHNHVSSGDRKEVDIDDEEVTGVTATTAVFTGTLVGFRSPFLEVVYTGADSPTYPRYRIAYSDDLSWTEENIIRTNWQTGIAVRDTIAATMTGLKSSTQYLVLIETEKSAGNIYEGTGKTFTTLYGSIYPSAGETRITSLVHRFDRSKGKGTYTLEASLGEVTAGGWGYGQVEELPSIPTTGSRETFAETFLQLPEYVCPAGTVFDNYTFYWYHMVNFHPGVEKLPE